MIDANGIERQQAFIWTALTAKSISMCERYKTTVYYTIVQDPAQEYKRSLNVCRAEGASKLFLTARSVLAATSNLLYLR